MDFDFKKQVDKYNQLMQRAREVNARRDESERKMGLGTPDQGPLSLQLRTVMSAIQAGIISEDWNAVAEGQAMLEVIEKRERQAEQGKN